jgi:hypothetical protein
MRFFVQVDSIELFRALGTDAVAEQRFRMFRNIVFDLVPEALIIPNFLAVGADRDQPFERLYN